MDKTKGISWQHPGGKLLRMGAESLTEAELLSILVSSGTQGISAEYRKVCHVINTMI